MYEYEFHIRTRDEGRRRRDKAEGIMKHEQNFESE